MLWPGVKDITLLRIPYYMYIILHVMFYIHSTLTWRDQSMYGITATRQIVWVLSRAQPTSVDPVKATLSTSSCVASILPMAPEPVNTLKTPGGRPASAHTYTVNLDISLHYNQILHVMVFQVYAWKKISFKPGLVIFFNLKHTSPRYPNEETTSGLFST